MKGLQRRLRLLNTTRQVVGSWQAVRLALVNALTRPPQDRFDPTYGVDTRDELDPQDAALPAGEGDGAEKYAPTHPRVLRHVLTHLDVDYSRTTFVDIGCGKGRGVLMATGLPFQKVVGVELSPLTSAIARRNVQTFLARARDVRCREVEILNQNALGFRLPDSDVVLYLFHPFGSEVLERFVDHVGRQVLETPHRVRMAYSMLLPPSDRVLARSPHLQKLREYETLSGVHSWSLWEFQRPV